MIWPRSTDNINEQLKGFFIIQTVLALKLKLNPKDCISCLFRIDKILKINKSMTIFIKKMPFEANLGCSFHNLKSLSPHKYYYSIFSAKYVGPFCGQKTLNPSNFDEPK